MSYSQRFLDRHPPQPEDTIAEPKLMDDDEEADGGSRHHRRRHRTPSESPGASPSASAHRRAHASTPQTAPADKRGSSSARAAPLPAQPFGVLGSPHRRPPAASPPPQVAESRKVFVSPSRADTKDMTATTASTRSGGGHTSSAPTPHEGHDQGPHGQSADSTVHAVRQSPSSPSSSPLRSAGQGTSDTAAAAYARVLAERDTALRLLDTFKTEGNKVIQRLHQSLTAQQRENEALTAALAARPAPSPISRGPHDAPGTTLRVIELEEKVMAQTHVIQELDKLMRSADTMMLAMRARCEAAEQRSRRLEAEVQRVERRSESHPSGADVSGAENAASAVPPLNLGTVQLGAADEAASARGAVSSSPPRSPTTSVSGSGLPGELLANQLRDKYASDTDVQAAVTQWMAAQAHIHALRTALDEERRLRLSAEEAYQCASTEGERAILLLERRLHRARTPRGMAYRGFDADLLHVPMELAPRSETAESDALFGEVDRQPLKGKAGRTVVTLAAAPATTTTTRTNANHARADGTETPPSPLMRERDGDVRSAQSTPTKLLFTMGSETMETRTSAGGKAGGGTGTGHATRPSAHSAAEPVPSASFASDAASYDSATVPIDAPTDDRSAAAADARARTEVDDAQGTETETSATDATTHTATGEGAVTTKRRKHKKRTHRTEEAAVSVPAPATVAPTRAISVERDLTRRRDSSEPSSPRPVSSPVLSHAAVEAKPPLTPRMVGSPRAPLSNANHSANNSFTARKRFIGERRPNDSINSASHESGRAAAAAMVDIPIPDAVTSAAASVRNASFASAASSRASSVGSRSGRLVNLRPREASPSNPTLDAAPEDDGASPAAVSSERRESSESGRRRHHPQTADIAQPVPSTTATPATGASVAEEVKKTPVSSPSPTTATSRARSSRVSEERQRALSQGLQELDQINADVDKILRTLSPGKSK